MSRCGQDLEYGGDTQEREAVRDEGETVMFSWSPVSFGFSVGYAVLLVRLDLKWLASTRWAFQVCKPKFQQIGNAQVSGSPGL